VDFGADFGSGTADVMAPQGSKSSHHWCKRSAVALKTSFPMGS
jgi:hypothetical protein